jgi:hypothetical protein
MRTGVPTRHSRACPTAGLLCVIAVMGLSLLSAQPSGATTNCVALEVRTAEWGGGASALVRVDLTAGTSSTVTQLGSPVNAIGYAAQQNQVYGIATRDGGRLVRISTQGAVSDLGQVRGANGGLADAVAGAVLGSELYVRAGARLSAIGIDPSNSLFGAVTRSVELRPEWLADDVDDFAVDPETGLLYGVRGDAVVSIDPNSGAVREVRVVPGLPGWADFGSVVLSGRTMYAIADDVFGQSRLYRIPLDDSGPAALTANWPAADVTDLAGCLATPAPPTTPPPPPPTAVTRQPPPPPPPTTTTTTTRKPAPAQVIPPITTTIPPTTTTVPPPPPPVLPTPTSAPKVLPEATLLAQPSHEERNTERRWALTTVVIVFGGGAVAARRASARARGPK